MGLPWGSLLFVLTGALVTAAFLENYHPKRNITCSQGLAQCRAKQVFSLLDYGPVEVLSLDVNPMLCCRENRQCKACVHIRILLRIIPDEDEMEERSGEYEDEDNGDAAAVSVCYFSGPNLPQCWKISFLVTPAARENHENAELTMVQYDGIFLGTTVNVTVKSMIRSATFPSLSKVCPSADIEECETPRIFTEIDRLKGVVVLKEANENMNKPKTLSMCLKRGRQGTCWPFNSSKWTIPLHSVTPCLCFQVWKEESAHTRSEFCPFTNNTEFQKNVMRNVSLSVAHAVSNDGHPVLNWNLTAPCRLEAELWLCQMGLDSGSTCGEVQGFRQTLGTSSQWQENSTTLWTSGAFVDFHSTNIFLHCVTVKLDGEILDPLCQYDFHRGRWTILVLVTLLIFILALFGMYMFKNKLKGWHSHWDKIHHSQGLREVLLLHSCNPEMGQDHLVCSLGTMLSELGFKVHLDLWSQKEVCALGPAPWLHSHLDHVHKHGGRALIVLSSSALNRAKDFWDVWNREESQERRTLPGILSDVFGSALNCMLRDHLKGGSGEHFSLVQFDSQEIRNGDRDIPELFRRLRIYRLPSETRQLLMELHTDRSQCITTQLKMVLWLSSASRRLVKGLRDSEKELWTHAETMLTKVELLNTKGEETCPLQI